MLEKMMVRDYEPADANFILKTWQNCYRTACPHMPTNLYYDRQGKTIAALVQATAQIRIACDKEKPEFIFGFLIYEELLSEDPSEPVLIHFGFTKLSYRKHGVFKLLLDSVGWTPAREVWCTHYVYTAIALRGSSVHLVEYPLHYYALLGLDDWSIRRDAAEWTTTNNQRKAKVAEKHAGRRVPEIEHLNNVKRPEA